ncbi:hypothetical protein [Streptomyces mirabilis]|uniref:Uncharacterized protein n=1 Tax=Streptomyces mirabilis TaxID=68239 RepID=A0ABU3V5F3_9ACTN|nr:hypothetical protein [Streptomyces mirabilis]MCX5355756.1 hypothetical protein [Streptomyces mirabilis]MDU9001399.1 hypothetical protein [Streptomyces mirabilis]
MINSLTFRSSGQDLTTAGTDVQMTSRLAEPVLVGIAALAVGSREAVAVRAKPDTLCIPAELNMLRLTENPPGGASRKTIDVSW